MSIPSRYRIPCVVGWYDDAAKRFCLLEREGLPCVYNTFVTSVEDAWQAAKESNGHVYEVCGGTQHRPVLKMYMANSNAFLVLNRSGPQFPILPTGLRRRLSLALKQPSLES